MISLMDNSAEDSKIKVQTRTVHVQLIKIAFQREIKHVNKHFYATYNDYKEGRLSIKSRLHEVKAIIPLFTNMDATETACTSLGVAIDRHQVICHTYIAVEITDITSSMGYHVPMSSQDLGNGRRWSSSIFQASSRIST